MRSAATTSSRSTLRLYGRSIDDIIDYVPIGATGQAPGNLDQATVYGVLSRSTINLDSIGWRGARFDASMQWQDSEVEDPLTGEQRPISNSLQELFSFALRHDLPNTDWAWGTGYSYQLYAKNYRLTEVGRLWEGPVWGDVYLEHKDVAGLTVRAGVYNLLAADSMWDRTVHTGRSSTRTSPARPAEAAIDEVTSEPSDADGGRNAVLPDRGHGPAGGRDAGCGRPQLLPFARRESRGGA